MPEESPHSAFTLVEILVVLTVISLLVLLASPVMRGMIAGADNASCSANLRAIGVAALQMAQENNNVFPSIPGRPEPLAFGSTLGVSGFGDAFTDYGVTADTLRCPADVKGQNYFANRGSSYIWLAFIDGENILSPRIEMPIGRIPLPFNRYPLVSEFNLLHRGRMNFLFGDGRVEGFTSEGIRKQVLQIMQQ